MSGIPSIKMNNKPKKSAASKIPTSGRDSGTHSRSSSVSNLTSASDLHSETGDATSDTSADFKIDDRVWVNGTKPGCVKFIGKTEFAPGIWAGVLLDEPVGKNDGSVAGVKYFTCEPMKGIFARPGKLSRTSGAVSSIGDSPMVGVTPKACNIVRASSRTSVCSNMSTPGPRYSSSYRLKVGDRVTVSSLNGLKLGTLRFLGEADFAKGEWAGVELDEPTGKNDGSVAGKRYFTCEMKYGLFAPLHKVSRPGASPVSRPGSVRGTPLCRSNSRDSLNSSVSNSSRASRIRLGITSLTSAQKSKASGMGVTSATKAFEEAIKEKELHIEQLLKERELDRAEFARLANHFEQIESKSSELEKKQKILESEKKTVNEQLTTLQKKHEDTQFQLEEEKIAKTDFEMQLQQRSQILKRINEFISKETEGKFLNIKEILSGQEVLSEINQIASVGDSSASGEFQTKIGELENLIQSLSLEKKELQNKVTELQKCSGEHSTKFESEIISLKTVVQEKDDMITNLKSELNNNIEKVTQLIEDNKYLNEQMLLKEEQAKGHADYVIKELGEKINSLNEQLKMQSSQLAEQVTSVEEKDNKIKTLEQSLNDQGAALLQLQNENKNVSDALKLKEITHEENMSSLKGLEGTIAALKVQLETVNDESQKKINLLEEEIKNKSGLLENYLSSMEEKENLITSLQKNFDSQAAAILQLQNEKKDLNDFLKQRESELNEKAAKQKLLEEQLCALTSQSESSTVENEEKMLDLVKKIEQLTNCLQEKDELLLKNQSELSSSQNAVEELKETVQQLSDKLQQANLLLTTSNADAAETLSNLKDQLNASAQEKDDLKSDYAKEIAVLKTTIKVQEDELQAKIDIVGQHESQIVLLTEKLKKMDDENVGLKMEIETLSEKNRESIKDKEQLEMAFKAKDEDLVDLVKQLENAKKDLEKNSLELEQNSKQLQILQDTLNLKEEENNQLTSKLQLAEQNVEMLNKDSSDHVMALQTELSKLKEESISAKTHIEQELSKVRNEKEKVLKDLKEKEDSLLEKEENLSSLEKKLTEKDSEISDLLTLKTNLSQTVSKYNSDIEEAKKSEEQISKTLSECEAKLSEKEQELITLKNDVGKLSDTISEKDKALLEKEEFASSLQNKLTDRETEISNLSAQNADLLSNISKFSVDIEESQRIFNEKLANSTAELDNKLKEKDEVIQDIQNQLQKSSEILENKTKELNNKEGELNVLKNIVKEKDAQFEELGQMIESSQKQLALLKEQNEKNESLLQSKESFINEFKVEQEKQLQLKDQSFKEEALKLQSLITSKDDEINSKQLEVSSLLNEVENKKKLVDALQIELETAKVDKNRISEDKSNIYQELNNRIAEIEEKYSKLLEEKEKIAKEELQTRDAKKNLEKVRDKLLEEKSAQEEVVKDRETKLAALQAEIARMQEAFAQHKQELLEKLDVNKMELQAASELKNELDIQHSVIETLQQNLNNSEMKCKEFEEQVLTLPIITSQKNQLQAQIDEFQKISQEKSEMVTKVQEKNLALEEQLNNNKNLILQKEKELSGLKEQLKKASVGKSLPDNSSLKFLEEENLALKNQITFLELKNSENSDKASNILRKEVSPEEEEDRECLLSQVDFLNSIIVDLKQKNEELTRQLEAQMSCWEENDVNLNETSKAIAPRLFCDICDMFDLHDTGDCPKQESCIDEKVPQLRLAGTRQIEERPYCNNCEMFGHWTLDCDEPDTF